MVEEEFEEEEFWEEEDEWEEMECLGLINIAYGEICEVCEFREVCEELAKQNDEEEREGRG
ncbi:hypothetical protein VFC49_06890 [Thermococcus sp. SY098]|uniref:hypothetical protein n=1 Tax=Thermococcus sp. SY098 TaxID=3111325 RepID=UPI002D7A0CF2|nr:hypothetical protein [Thermococcus sp. SY098]WRS51811.1 hypothetical protein VFC49_06890 [Thermococcus sp. SY098]